MATSSSPLLREHSQQEPGSYGVRTNPVASVSSPDPGWRTMQRTIGNRAMTRLLGESSSGRPLDAGMRNRMEARFGTNLEQVRIHTGRRAETAASTFRAKAFTVGQDIALGVNAPALSTPAGQTLLAHELRHTVQQGPQSNLSALARMTAPSDRVEREANSDSHRITFDNTPRIAREPVDAGAPPASTDAVLDQVLEQLNKSDPIAGVGDPSAALRLLVPLPLPDLLRVLGKIADLSRIGELLAVKDTVSIADTSLRAALEVLDLAQGNAAAQSPGMFDRAGQAVAALAPADQDLIFRFMIGRIGQAANVDAIIEGVVALMDSMKGIQDASPDALASVGAAVMPGPWAPPGNQPIPYYIGNQAHVGITAEYAALHLGDVAFYNYNPMSTIIDAWINTMGKTANPAALTAKRLGLKPDIANLSRSHLYEIKPKSAEALGSAEARMYLGLFTAVGIPMTLGPTTEPGTAGGIPAPGGVYLFNSPQPGVITYQYQRAKLVPIPVPAEEKARQPSQARLPRFKLEPIHIQVAATITIGAIMLYILYAAGAGILALSG